LQYIDIKMELHAQNYLQANKMNLHRLQKYLVTQHVWQFWRFYSSSNTCICGELVEELGLAQSTISQHLKELKTADIIKGNIEGTSVCYCINEEKWFELKVNLQ